ncbi:MAG TPA: twin-arginine translocation signal domain-containing protein [Verrucomicrobiales bacterium]|nr:twin-arginine translocation signal domain-containing protein [Verrucomicrobiales bacterium]
MFASPSRRSFLAQLSALAGAAVAAPAPARGQVPSSGETPTSRKKVAFLGTVVRTHSHAQHFLDRLTLGYGWNGAWQDPRVEVASVYIDQFPENDLARERVARHQLTLYPSIADALTLGTGRLAVDGVVLIAEHGDYPQNEKGQRLYPRYEWFKQCIDVFEASGRSVAVFNDKHLSTTWERCSEMVADSKRLGFPFLAGSSLPVTRRLPAIDMPHGTPLQESVCVAYGGVDSYDFHALETAQCMSERRQGGETGVRSVHALRGAPMWELLSAPEREATRRLIVSALTRSHNLPVEGGYYTGPISFDWARNAFPEALGYFMEHRDGFRTSVFLMGIQDFNYAGLRADTGEIVSCQMYLPMPTHGSSTADFFHPLVRHIEDTVIHDRTPYPVERTLLTSGMTLAAVESLHRGQVPIETPEMEVGYHTGPGSTYWID